MRISGGAFEEKREGKKVPDEGVGDGTRGMQAYGGLEVVDVAKGDAIAFGAVFGVHFEVEVGEEVVVGGEAPEGAGTEGDDLFFAAGGVIAIDFAVGDLAEGITVDADAEMFFNDFVFGGEVGVEGLAGLGVFYGGVG